MEQFVSEVRHAVYRGDRAAAHALVAGGAALNVFDAAALGEVIVLDELLAGDATLAHAWAADGFTALHFAAFLGVPDAVRSLLHSAAAHGDVQSCRLLLDAGADPNAKQQGDHTPLDEAVRSGNDALAALLRDRGAT